MNQQSASELLLSIAAEHGVPLGLLVELIEIERDHRFQLRRSGIFDELEECIRRYAEEESSANDG